MPRLLARAKVLWVELVSDLRILDALDGFDLCSTELLFRDCSRWHDENLEKTRESPASTGATCHFAWHGPWRNFRSEFLALKRHGLIQTDIVARRRR